VAIFLSQTQMISIRNKALQLLSRRDHSRKELQQKLALSYPDLPLEEINAVLDNFIQLGWQSDARFAEQWVYYRSQRYGQQRLRHELYEKGIDSEIINQVLTEVIDDEETAARAIWQKKFPIPPRNINERAKQLRYLASRGFSLHVIYAVVSETNEDEML
jgi:regulatory protein